MTPSPRATPGGTVATIQGQDITAGELEHVIERALMQIDGPIALEDLKAFMEAAGLIGRTAADPNQQTVH